LKDPGPPDAGTVWLPGAIEDVQPPACVMVKGWLATVAVPWRGAPVFCAITNWTLPLPLPDAPLLIVIHESVVDAVHEQPALAVTLTTTGSPPLPTPLFVGFNTYEHPPACVTVKVSPPAVIVAVRGGPLLAPAEYRTVPFPLPFALLITVSHDALLATDHAQPSLDRMSNAPLPPPAGAVAELEVSANEQPCP
jgi:hypothetical protein